VISIVNILLVPSREDLSMTAGTSTEYVIINFNYLLSQFLGLIDQLIDSFDFVLKLLNIKSDIYLLLYQTSS